MTAGWRWSVAMAMTAAVSACGGTAAIDEFETHLIEGSEEAEGDLSTWNISGNVPAGTTLEATANVNLRRGPSTNHGVVRVVPLGSRVTVIDGRPNNLWYRVRFAGSEGWSYGRYYKLTEDSAAPAPTRAESSSGEREDALERARAGVGFSYWWGHGRWLESGPTSSTRGSCTGSCPECSHGGRYGADCSGYVAKIWQVPASNDSLSDDSHPYSTANFYGEQRAWNRIDRSGLKPADALVYRSGDSGHIAVFERGDAWGSMWVYEARGCSYGIVHNLRSFGNTYRAIGRY